MTDEREIHDPAIDALLRTHLEQTPSPSVDAAILAAAHRAVEAPRRASAARATHPWRWWMPLAAAAAIGIVVIGIVPLAPTLVEPATPTVSDAPTGGPLTGPTSKSTADSQVGGGALPRTSQTIEPSDTPELPAKAAIAARSSAPSPTLKLAKPSATPEPGTARESADRGAMAPLTSKADVAAAELPMAPAAAPAAAANASRSEAAPRPDAMPADQRARQGTRTPSADEWIARIRTFRNDGRSADAARALTEFRAQFGDADTRLPDDLREWAKTVH
jgi:Meckel syndrome type 1 protein